MDSGCEMTSIKIAGHDLTSVLIHCALRKRFSGPKPQPAGSQFGDRNRVSLDLEVRNDILGTFVHIERKHQTRSAERHKRWRNFYLIEALRFVKRRQQFDAGIFVSTSAQKTGFTGFHVLL